MLRKLLLTIIALFLVIGFARADEAAHLYSEGKKHLRKNQQDMAFLRFSHIAKFYPTSRYADEAQFRVAEYYFKNKKYRSAMIELETYLKRFPEGKFRRQVQVYIDGIAAGKTVKEADRLVGLKRWQDAYELYEQALEADPTMPGLTVKVEACKEKVVEELIKEGELLAARKQREQAAEAYMKALELDPSRTSLEGKVEELRAELSSIQDQPVVEPGVSASEADQPVQ